MKLLPDLLFFGILLWSCEQKTETPTDEKYLIAFNTFEPDSIAKDNWEIRVLDPEDSSKSSRNVINNPDVAWTYLAHEDKIFFISGRDTAYRNFFCMKWTQTGQG